MPIGGQRAQQDLALGHVEGLGGGEVGLGALEVGEVGAQGKCQRTRGAFGGDGGPALDAAGGEVVEGEVEIEIGGSLRLADRAGKREAADAGGRGGEAGRAEIDPGDLRGEVELGGDGAGQMLARKVIEVRQTGDGEVELAGWKFGVRRQSQVGDGVGGAPVERGEVDGGRTCPITRDAGVQGDGSGVETAAELDGRLGGAGEMEGGEVERDRAGRDLTGADVSGSVDGGPEIIGGTVGGAVDRQLATGDRTDRGEAGQAQMERGGDDVGSVGPRGAQVQCGAIQREVVQREVCTVPGRGEREGRVRADQRGRG